MNLNDKNIDQLFRDAAQNSSSPRYDNSYWKEMSSVLDAQDKRKRGFILWSIAGSIVSILLVSALFISNNKKSDSLIANKENTYNNISQKSIEDKQHVKENIQSQNSSTKAKNQKFDKDEIKKIESNDKKSSISKSNNSIKTANNNSNKGSNISSNGYNPEGVKDRTQKNPFVSDNPTLETNSIESKSPTKESLNNKTLSENTPETFDDLPVESLAPRKIALQMLETENGLLPFKLLKENPINFYAKLSAGLMENYETSRPFQSGVFDLSLNIEYAKEQVLFRTGIGFQATSNADLVVSERAKVYGFGVTTHQNNLSYQSIYDVFIPLELGYSLNNTSFGFGAQINYMLGTTMNYESLENKVIVDQYKLKGFTEGLNNITAQGYVWLEQKISERFAAGIKVGTNLNSRIKEGRYFNESATTNPLYGQLTLRYNLNK